MNLNRGVQQFGGSSQVGIQAVGDNASAKGGDVHIGTHQEGAGASVTDLLAVVRELLREHQDTLPEADRANTTTDILDEELEQEEPSAGVVARLLTRLSGLVAPVKPIAEAVAELAKAVHATIGG